MVRLDYIDKMRGFAILLVIAGHILQYNGIPTDNPAFEWIYSFHMPLFFAISGFVADKYTHINGLRELMSFYFKKVIAIGLPFIIWSIFLFTFMIADTFSLPTFDYMVGQIKDPILWFFKTLLFIFGGYGLFNYIFTKNKTYWAIGILVVYTFLVVFSRVEAINFILYSIAFYFGVVISHSQRLYILTENDFVITLSGFGFVILSSSWNFSGG